MPARISLSIAVAVAVLFTGSCWAGIAQVAHAASDRAEYVAALADTEAARDAALALRLELAVTQADAKGELESVRALLAVGAAWTDAASLDDIGSLAQKLAKVVPQEPPPLIPAYEPGALDSLDAWQGRFAAMERLADDRLAPLDRALAAVRELIANTVRAASKASPGAVSAATLVTEAQRDAARVALDGVAAAMRAGENPIVELTTYATVLTQTVTAQRDAEVAAAEAAAAAAAGASAGSSGSGGAGRSLFPSLAPQLNLDDLPYVVTAGTYNYWGCVSLGQVDAFTVPFGATVVLDYPFPYKFGWYGTPGGGSWDFIVEECA